MEANNAPRSVPINSNTPTPVKGLSFKRATNSLTRSVSVQVPTLNRSSLGYGMSDALPVQSPLISATAKVETGKDALAVDAYLNDAFELGEDEPAEWVDVASVLSTFVPFNPLRGGLSTCSELRGLLPELWVDDLDGPQVGPGIWFTDSRVEAAVMYAQGGNVRWLEQGDLCVERDERMAEISEIAHEYIEAMQRYKRVPHYFPFRSLQPYTDFPDDLLFPMFALLYGGGFNVCPVLVKSPLSGE